ncbi:MAG: tetratricopeptide repeat protein [Sandaracinaceae bacterium]
MAWTKMGVPFVRASTLDGPRAWAFGVSGGTCVRIDLKTRRRSAEPRFSSAMDAEVGAFLDRIAWLRGEKAPSPGRAAEAVSRLSDALKAVRTAEALLSVEDRTGPLREHHLGSVRAIGILKDIVAGDWGRVFPQSDTPGVLPTWARTVLIALSGVVSRLGEQVALPAAPTPATVLEGRALAAAGFEDAALDRLDHATAALHGPLGATLGPDMARLARRVGRDDDAIGYLRRSILQAEGDDHLLQRCCFELVRLGAIDDAHQALAARCLSEPVGEEIALAHAQLLMWAERTQEARPLLARLRDHPRGRRLDGVRQTLEGDWEGARDTFEAVLETMPDDRETHTWLAEVYLHLNDDERYQAHLDVGRAESQTAAHTLLSRATEVYLARPYQTGLNHLLDALGEPLGPWWNDGGPREEGMRVLRRFGGNRSEHLTLMVPGTEGLGLVPFSLPPQDALGVSRDAASDVLKGLTHRPRHLVEEDFRALAARFPDSPHPLCYWGELDLWMGDYDRAIDRFRKALQRGSARWAYVGEAACHIMRGDWAEADRVLTECSDEYTPILGATTHVYLGEALRRRGAMAAAARELEEAVRVKRGRAGAWLNLALVYRALDDATAADAAFREVEERWPRLLWDGWIALGEPPTWPVPHDRRSEVAESVLRMMRGNRSSHTITYFDHAGTFRIARDVRALQKDLAAHAHFLAPDLRARVVAGTHDETPASPT